MNIRSKSRFGSFAGHFNKSRRQDNYLDIGNGTVYLNCIIDTKYSKGHMTGGSLSLHDSPHASLLIENPHH